MSADGTEAAANESDTLRGGAANLRPPSTSAEAREWGRRGGIASGEARRKRASLRAELEALLTVDDGAVAKSIAVAICRAAKQGNVGAFRAIAQVLGELREVVGVEAEGLPPPIVLAVHDPGFIEAERERQRREFGEIVDVAVAELTQQPDGVATSATRSSAESTERGRRAAGDAPGVPGDKTPAPEADAPQAPSCADSAQAPESDGGRNAVAPPPSRIPRSPSEAAAMRREREAREREQAQSGNPSPAQTEGAARPYRPVPVAFSRR